jgi:TonB family protein
MNRCALRVSSDSVQHGARIFSWGAAITLALLLAAPAQAASERPTKLRVAPVYPEIAKRMHLFGEVKVEVTVDADGKVTAVRTIDGAHILSVAAEEAVRKWKFEPASSSSTEEFSINFPRMP